MAIYNDHKYIIHTTNLSEYKIIIQEIEQILNEPSGLQWQKDTLSQQVTEITHVINTLETPRRLARSIDFLGSVLKFIAGTPDHDDYEKLLTKENTLIENSNQQTKINSQFQERINEITDRINALLKGDNIRQNENESLLQYLIDRNNHIINSLNNIVLSVILAKNDMINPLILDDLEMKHIIDSGNSPISISNLLSAAKVKILQNSNVIYYILKIPNIQNFCNLMKIFPVSHNDKIIELEFNQAADCVNRIQPLTECSNTTDASMKICKPTNPKCLTQLLNTNVASCATESSHHLELVQEVDEGTIILNDVANTKIVDQHQINVTGTFLLTFTDSVLINETRYQVKRKEVVYMEPHPPKIISLKHLQHTEKLSLPYLHKIHINNTSIINALQHDLATHSYFWWIALTTILVLGIICLIKILNPIFKNNTRKVTIDAKQIDAVLENIETRTSRTLQGE